MAEWVKSPPGDRTDDEKIWLVRFFIVRVCGYLEQVTFECARAYIDGKSGGPVRAFSQSWIVRTKNPSPHNILSLAGRFGGGFEESLRDLLNADDQKLSRELEFLVNRRHRIAHGQSEGLNRERAVKLYEGALEIANWFLENLNPNRR
ncbi:HEPN domain-containing protein [Streptomyces albidoflavus]|uniref:HEPN domain-containing protein n=1 Tax=Streptomyces albidoflavus TaxID=1886 RepID=UPI00386E4516|nr:HEPN domain-containing protein [Streptomyces albidoflavus]